jgi:hypothetical protein
LQAEGFEASAVPGEKSQFDVVADGVTLFSKQQADRWPEPGEMLRLLTK